MSCLLQLPCRWLWYAPPLLPLQSIQACRGSLVSPCVSPDYHLCVNYISRRVECWQMYVLVLAVRLRATYLSTLCQSACRGPINAGPTCSRNFLPVRDARVSSWWLRLLRHLSIKYWRNYVWALFYLLVGTKFVDVKGKNLLTEPST